MAGPSLTVVIPTYQRPLWIARAVRSLEAQSRPPEEVIAVSRDDDAPTHEAIEKLQQHRFPFVLRRELVSEPGFIPPVRVGLRAAGGDIIAVIDDDAEAADGWSGRLVEHYAEAPVGAVGGRCINYSEAGPTPVGNTDRVGFVNLRGQFIGEMYNNPTFHKPVEVDFLMGGNMSVRRQIARRLEFDMELNRNVAQGYEVDIGLQIRRLGWKIIFDPAIAIRHYSAPRATTGLRASEAEGVQWYAFNQARVAMRRLSPLQGSVSFAYQMAVGERRAPGLLSLVLPPVGRRLGFDVEQARPALRGRVLAARSLFRRPTVSS